jgi:hypothetical protein
MYALYGYQFTDTLSMYGNISDLRMPYVSCVLVVPSASPEVVLSGKLSTIRYDDAGRYGADAGMCLVHVSLDGIQEDK